MPNSLVCFPVKKEQISVVLRNIEIAANHPCIQIVLLSAATDNDCYHQLTKAITVKKESTEPYPVPVNIILQNHLGDLRCGKGDGMNSALQYFLNAHKYPENQLDAPLRNIHFYDADIESFDETWITKAEEGASLGYDVVRHYFPRSSTDAQITWQVTKVGFALLWPRTTLPWVQQPLGGELCFTRHVVEALMDDPRVVNQSDWGIDTLYTFVCAQRGFSLLEAYVPQGKMHALYNGLRDLKTMLCECFSAIQSLRNENVLTAPTVHRIDPPAAVPASVTQKIGYDIEKSLKLLRENWSEKQQEYLTFFPTEIQDGLMSACEWPEYMFMDEKAWIRAYPIFLEHFDLRDEDWRELLFKTWVARVLNYTMRHVLRGYHVALQANTDMVMRLHMKQSAELFGRDQMRMTPIDVHSNVSTEATSDVSSLPQESDRSSPSQSVSPLPESDQHVE